jgi:hypothetical protein
MRRVVTPKMFKHALRRRLQGRQALAGDQGQGGRDLSLGCGLDLRQNPPYFEGMTMEPEAVTDIVGARVLACSAIQITTDHISPAGNIPRQPGRQVPADHQVRSRGLQLLRRAPRQPRSDDARHLRQHPHQERDAAGVEGGVTPLHMPAARDADLRRGDEVYQGRRARRWSSSPARNTAPARRATGRPRAPTCWACAP